MPRITLTLNQRRILPVIRAWGFVQLLLLATVFADPPPASECIERAHALGAQVIQPNNPLEPIKLRRGQHQIALNTINGGKLEFELFGRTPAEKKFKAERDQIQAAGPDDLVPVEVAFLPYYKPFGHTALRIGNSLFEFTSNGWRAHEGGMDSARSYYYNNPYFADNFQRYSRFNMAPFAMGVTVMARKESVQALLEHLRGQAKVEGPEREKFKLSTYNCNQAIACKLTEFEIPGFEEKPSGYSGFSSVLSFRNLLLSGNHPPGALSIYALPGQQKTPEEVAAAVPPQLYSRNSPMREIGRVIWERIFHMGLHPETDWRNQ